MDYKKIYESKNATITLDSFYSENERMTKEPFPFPITVLLNEGDGYEQTYADTNYSLIEITNVTEKNFPTGVYRPENFNQHAWTSFETDAVYDMEDFIFHFGNNTTAHGYKELVKIIQKKNPNLDIKPDPFWLKPVTFKVEIGGSMDYDYFFNMNNPSDLSIVCDNFKYSKMFRGVYVATISTDIKEMLYNKYKLPVIKNGGPILLKKKDNNGPRHFNLGRITNESAGQKNFFDHLDGNWEDVLSNTYAEANKRHLLLKIHTKTKKHKLFCKMFGFENVEECELAFYITEEKLQEVLKNHIGPGGYFVEDELKDISIPKNLINIELNGKPLKLKIVYLDDPTYDIELDKNNEIVYFRVFNLTYGHVYSVLDYQADCRYFTYYKEHENKDLNDFIITFNKDLFKNYEINL